MGPCGGRGLERKDSAIRDLPGQAASGATFPSLARPLERVPAGQGRGGGGAPGRKRSPPFPDTGSSEYQRLLRSKYGKGWGSEANVKQVVPSEQKRSFSSPLLCVIRKM